MTNCQALQICPFNPFNSPYEGDIIISISLMWKLMHIGVQINQSLARVCTFNHCYAAIRLDFKERQTQVSQKAQLNKLLLARLLSSCYQDYWYVNSSGQVQQGHLPSQEAIIVIQLTSYSPVPPKFCVNMYNVTKTVFF